MATVVKTEPRANAVSFRRPVVWAVVVAAVVLIAHAPLLKNLAIRMWAAEHYQFFPLILLGAGVLAFQRIREDRPPLMPGRFLWRLVLWGIAAFLLVVAILLRTPWLAALAALASLFAFGHSMGGRSLMRRLWPAWGFLWLAVPLPLGLDVRLIQSLQRLATVWASGVID